MENGYPSHFCPFHAFLPRAKLKNKRTKNKTNAHHEKGMRSLRGAPAFGS